MAEQSMFDPPEPSNHRKRSVIFSEVVNGAQPFEENSIIWFIFSTLSLPLAIHKGIKLKKNTSWIGHLQGVDFFTFEFRVIPDNYF